MKYESISQSEELDALVDIRNVRIDMSLPVEERIKSYVMQIKTPDKFKVGNTIVRISYANTQRTMNQNFVNMIASM